MSPNTMLTAKERRRRRRHCVDPTESRLSPGDNHNSRRVREVTNTPRRRLQGAEWHPRVPSPAARRKSCKIFIHVSHLPTPSRIGQHRPRSFTPPPPQHFANVAAKPRAIARTHSKENTGHTINALPGQEPQPLRTSGKSRPPATAIAHSKGQPCDDWTHISTKPSCTIGRASLLITPNRSGWLLAARQDSILAEPHNVDSTKLTADSRFCLRTAPQPASRTLASLPTPTRPAAPPGLLPSSGRHPHLWPAQI